MNWGIKMRNILVWLSITILISLSACSEGGDSSSGAGTGSEAASNPLSGSFLGSQTLTIIRTGSGITVTETTTTTFRLDVNSSGNTATVVDQNFQAAGPISNGQFTVSADTTFVNGTLSCNGVITYSGSVAPGDTNGDVSETAACTDSTLPGIGIASDTTGTFTGSK